MTVLDHYKKYVGKKELKKLLSRFDSNTFCSKWNQVMTSRSTFFMGSGGSEYSSVRATYTENRDKTITVFNECYDENHKPKTIQGISECVDPKIPTCRTVLFPSVGVIGNYWILYISKQKDVIIVCSPFIIPYTSVKLMDNLALYVLAKDRDAFWSNTQLVKKIYDILEKYKFDLFINKPIYSGV